MQTHVYIQIQVQAKICRWFTRLFLLLVGSLFTYFHMFKSVMGCCLSSVIWRPISSKGFRSKYRTASPLDTSLCQKVTMLGSRVSSRLIRRLSDLQKTKPLTGLGLVSSVGYPQIRSTFKKAIFRMLRSFHHVCLLAYNPAASHHMHRHGSIK